MEIKIGCTRWYDGWLEGCQS